MSNIPRRVGNYQLDQPIGRGMHSQVWLARHLTLPDRLAAVKLLLSQDAEWVERFRREAEITSRLHHDQIVEIYDHGHAAPFDYTVMQYVPGGALRDLLERGGRLPFTQAASIFHRVGMALDYAHSHGVVHRDVSPGNILYDPDTDQVRLCDFGIARESGRSQLTTVNLAMGTPGYLSPEHTASATMVTHLSDVYGLGVVLFVMLAGDLPWPYKPGLGSDGGVFAPPMALKERGVSGIPAEVDQIIATMLALDPAKRFPSARAAVEALDRVVRRHSGTTQIVTAGAPDPRATVLPLELPDEPHPVETVLGADLVKAPMQEAQARGAELADAQQIAALLNGWSRASRLGLRRPALGRQMGLRRVTSRNVYFYRLRVLYETREPARVVEEPDYKVSSGALERELDRWEIKLPPLRGFADEPGDVLRVPGSTRVVSCEHCRGIGRVICPRCQGRMRVAPEGSVAPEPKGRRAAATVGAPAVAAAATAAALVPCPECNGAGGLHCDRCDGVSRLLQHKTIRWSRRPSTLTIDDDLPRVDECWLRHACAPREVYCERSERRMRPEWQQVPAIATLIKRAEQQCGPDTQIALSEVTISFIPITEIVFDLDDPPHPQARPAKGKKPAAEGTVYRWHIYGFERRLPRDWRFLNWDRVIWLLLVPAVLVLALLLALALVR